MKKFLAFFMLIGMVYTVSAKPFPAGNANSRLSLAHIQKPVVLSYLFKYDMIPTGNPGEWKVYFLFYQKSDTGVITAVPAPTNIDITITSPVSTTVTFYHGNQTQLVYIVNLGSYPEYTYDLNITTNPLQISGIYITPVAQHV